MLSAQEGQWNILLIWLKKRTLRRGAPKGVVGFDSAAVSFFLAPCQTAGDRFKVLPLLSPALPGKRSGSFPGIRPVSCPCSF